LTVCGSEREPDVHSRLAATDVFKGSRIFAAAESSFRRVVASKEFKRLGWVWVLRGANFARAEHFSEAEECHRRASQDPDIRDEALFNLALVLRAQERYAEAESVLREVLTIASDELLHKAQVKLRGLQTLEESRALVKAVASARKKRR
jgi:tetratricopeptide (TPR) repeat protein